MLKPLSLAALLAMAAGGVAAQEVAVETATLGKSAVTLHLHPFLTDEELATLRLVMTNKQALAMFLPGKAGTYAAMAVAPDEGFVRDGAPVASASALADFPDAEAARAAALAACDGARKAKAPCVIVLDVGPGK